MVSKSHMMDVMQRMHTGDKNTLADRWRKAMSDRPTVVPWIWGITFAGFMVGSTLMNVIHHGPAVVTGAGAIIAALTIWYLQRVLWFYSQNSAEVAILNRLREMLAEADVSLLMLTYSVYIRASLELDDEYSNLSDAWYKLDGRAIQVSQAVQLEKGDIGQFRAIYQIAVLWTSGLGQDLRRDIAGLKMRVETFKRKLELIDFEARMAERLKDQKA